MITVAVVAILAAITATGMTLAWCQIGTVDNADSRHSSGQHCNLWADNHLCIVCWRATGGIHQARNCIPAQPAPLGHAPQHSWALSA